VNVYSCVVTDVELISEAFTPFHPAFPPILADADAPLFINGTLNSADTVTEALNSCALPLLVPSLTVTPSVIVTFSVSAKSEDLLSIGPQIGTFSEVALNLCLNHQSNSSSQRSIS